MKQRIPPNQGPVVGMPPEPEKVAGAKQLVGLPTHCRWCRQMLNSLQQRSLHPTKLATPIAAAEVTVAAHTALQDWKLLLQTRRVPVLQAPGDAACLVGCTGLAEKGGFVNGLAESGRNVDGLAERGRLVGGLSCACTSPDRPIKTRHIGKHIGKTFNMLRPRNSSSGPRD